MALMAVLEADLRALSVEARRRYPAVKEAAEHAILKLRSHPDPALLARSDDILRIFIMACECKNVKLSITGLACLQKWIAHGAVPPSSLPEILATLKEHADINDETVQLKTLQAILTIFQSQLHPEDEDNMAIALGICFRLLENNKNPDSVHSTAAATIRQAVALIFDRVIAAEGLPVGSAAPSRRTSRSNSVSGDVSRSIIADKAVELEKDLGVHGTSVFTKEQMTQAARLGLRLFEDLTAVATGGPASWLRVHFLQRTFALDMIEYVLSNYVSIFWKLGPYQSVLRRQVCSLLMTSLRTTGELEGEVGEPSFRRLVLRCVANVLRLYSSILITECEVFLNMLLKSINLELPLWHRIMVLEVLRGFCVEARILRLLFQTFDMRPENTNVVRDMVRVLANVVTNSQAPDASEESLAAVAGMFNSKAKGLEWSMDYDASGVAVVVASEAHAITLAVEGLLGVVFTVATLTDEAIDAGELASPRCEPIHRRNDADRSSLVFFCVSMVNSVWHTLLDALSFILARSQGEAIVLEILKGYQAFTQACGVLRAVEPLNAFLGSLCKFALVPLNDVEKTSGVLLSPSGKRSDSTTELKDIVVLTPKNVQALRTIFNIAHRLDSVLGPSWTLVLETLALLDRVIHSPHATTQEVSAVVPRFSRDLGTQSSDFNILSTLDSQLFESSAFMSTEAVCSLITALRQVSNESVMGVTSGLSQTASSSASNVGSSVSGSIQQTIPKMFAVERMVATLINNLHRADVVWDQIVAHFLELAEHESSQVRSVALDALDRAICSVIACERIKNESGFPTDIPVHGDEENKLCGSLTDDVVTSNVYANDQKEVFNPDAFENKVILPIRTLYSFGQSIEARSGALKILLHVLERHGEKLCHSWPDILELLRSVANTSEKDFIPLAFQSVCVIMNDGLMSIPSHALDTCIEVAGAFGAQRRDVNISLTAIGLLWTMSDFFARGLSDGKDITQAVRRFSAGALQLRLQHQIDDLDMGPVEIDAQMGNLTVSHEKRSDVDYKRLLLAVYDVIQGFGTDERPEVRNTAIDTLFMSISRHGHKLSTSMLEYCLWNLVFPLIDTVRHLASTSSKDEWYGRELGTQGGKPVHMLVHHSRNTAQKQWDETLVFVLNGIRRLLKHLFVHLQSVPKFKQGWDCLFDFIKETMLNGSKEVALAAITTLHVIVTTHASKGSMSPDYFEVAFRAYEDAITGSANAQSTIVYKARQELLRNIAELYKQAYEMFESNMYHRLLLLVDVSARSPYNASDKLSSQDNTPLVQRTVLEVLPNLKPLDDQFISFWCDYLRLMAGFLLNGDRLTVLQGDGTCHGMDGVMQKQAMTSVHDGSLAENQHQDSQPRNQYYSDVSLKGTETVESCIQSPDAMAIEWTIDPSFMESIISILQTHYALAPSPLRLDVLPDVLGGLGRCMSTRRDFPFGTLWRVAATTFNRLLLEDLDSYSIMDVASKVQPDKLPNGVGQMRFWKQLADIYEVFLGGSCGRAVIINAESTSEDTIKADELLEQEVLETLCNQVLKSCQTAPHDVITKIVQVIDRCASRTSMLPLGSVELLPAHCSRFSFNCLQALFNISR
ncbi:hypothetical protein KP509_17G014700 [Ceratopteris richardii]|nr:hypothetical protein KP509_17G014700 [Ceratopteris richardii]KAH7372648.1 hypothetical protein KP509_17G014700 [Ceratopteris richardii]KAH7372649.1 hypothetical protein KP509_17G014700 [Ceratopteris richardii]